MLWPEEELFARRGYLVAAKCLRQILMSGRACIKTLRNHCCLGCMRRDQVLLLIQHITWWPCISAV